ncbi:MAG: pseudouridine synthase [Bacteroidota bacterium]
MSINRNFIIHKPYGFLSQFITNQTKRKNKKLLGELLFDFPEGTMAIGRLDEDSEGLLLLTTDGKLSEQVRSNKVEKEYYVQVDGIIDETAVKKLQDGVEISVNGKKYTTKPSKSSIIEDPGFPERSRKVRDDRHGPTSWVSVIISEGKFRQVRKMTAAAGFPTLRLVRIRIGNILLGELSSGQVIEVDDNFASLF